MADASPFERQTHLERALSILLTLQETNRLNPVDVPMIEAVRVMLQGQ